MRWGRSDCGEGCGSKVLSGYHVHHSDSVCGLAYSGYFILWRQSNSGVSFQSRLTMAKAKAPKEGKNSKSHLKARLEYLQRAAEYLQSVSKYPDQAGAATIGDATVIDNGANELFIPKDTSYADAQKPTSASKGQSSARKTLTNLSRVSISHMRGVSLKTQTRLPVPAKRSYCKRCDTLMLPEVNCTHEVINSSRGRTKPWADVLVVRCLVCSTEKRFPQTDRKSKKLNERKGKHQVEDQTDVS